MSVSCFVQAAAAQQGSGGVGLDTTMSVVGSALYNADSVESWSIYGYDNGPDFNSNGTTFGTLDEDTYTDAGSNSRTISALYWGEPGGGGTEDDDLFLCFDVASVPDTDTTFVSMDYNGVNYARTSATYYPTTASCSTWRWANITPNGPTSGTPAVVINI